ncbi:unnamed protein product [Knipowitschia caucasica]|uniref:Calcitonin peptide-like domain-containing protein n=1 Tax=Knipowitschia caucasica TaxID=637954 RepID=A0AAV2LN48_KNICA
MITLKVWTVLVAYALVICQMYAAPSRSSRESDGITLSEEEAQRLLSAIREFMQTTSDTQTAEDNSPDRPMSKRCTGLSTCVLGKLSQDIHKLQMFPYTDVGAGTPGKKRSVAEPFATSFN